jgi:predicted nucleic acid-binding protein
MIGISDSKFFDTSVLVYAFDNSDKTKHSVCLKMIDDMKEKMEKGILSTQVLMELYNVITRHITRPISPKDAAYIVDTFAVAESWVKLDYNLPTVRHAVRSSAETGTKIWDALIAETMKENGVTTIITENEKDFKKIPGIKVMNPFK